MQQDFEQLEYDRPRTRRRSRVSEFSDFEKKPPISDTIFRCTMARCVVVVGVILAAALTRSATSPEVVWVRSAYNRLMYTPMSQSVAVWQEVIDQSGAREVLWQLEEAVLVFAGAVDEDYPTDEQNLPPQEEQASSAQQVSALQQFGFVAGSTSALLAVESRHSSLGQGGWFGLWGEEQEQQEVNLPRTTPPGTTVQEPIMSSRATHPVTGVLSSEFGFRVHPITEQEDFHTGIDIAAPQGAPILAIYPGVVVEIGTSAIYGNYINLEHGGGVMSTYSHCLEVLATEGASIRAGERIATVGSTGISTGPHLHLELVVFEQSANPLYAFDLA